MGINRPSLYAAFGNKEELFRKALDRYVEGPAAMSASARRADRARGRRALFYGEIELLTNPKNPRGCLAVQSALACGESGSDDPRRALSRRKTLELSVRRRFKKPCRRRRLAEGRPRGAGQLHDGRDPWHGRPGRRRRESAKDLKRVAELALYSLASNCAKSPSR